MSEPIPFPDQLPKITSPEAESILMANAAIDLVFATATGLCRLTRSSTEEIPRLCVAAACRSVERLTARPEGHAVARLALHELETALTEGLVKTQQLIELLDAPEEEKPQ